MDYRLIIVLILIVVITIAICIKQYKFDSTEIFDKEKAKLKPHCSEGELDAFIKFLNSYEGGYFKRNSGKIVYRAYLGKEKGALKGVFYNIVMPNSNLSISKKEEFRKLIVSKGVDGLSERPAYETRDSKLKNNKEDEQEYKRKEVGNKGEQVVRDELGKLHPKQYSVINGPVLKVNGEIKEYDHIVIGKTGIFAIETKAFGMKNGNAHMNWLFIDKGDKWILGKGEHRKELTSPSEQIKAENEHLSKIVSSFPTEVHSILVLSNTQLNVKNNIKLHYDIVKADELVKFIKEYEDNISDGDKMSAISDINSHRIN